jgi:hypothetical protein
MTLGMTLETAQALVVVGSGFSNVLGGRSVPMLYGGLDTEKTAVTASATGVRNSLYYQSAYQLSYFRQEKFGAFWWGPIRAGLGFSVLWQERGYRETVDDAQATKNDWAAGPAFRVRWDIAPGFFVAVESLHGVRGLNVIALSFQHTTNLNFGVAF